MAARAFIIALAFVTLATCGAAGALGQTLLIEAQVHGESVLHVTADGLFWRHRSQHPKPTSITLDGKEWPVAWKFPDEPAGPDVSEPHPLSFDLDAFTAEVVYATTEAGGEGARRIDATVTIEWVRQGLLITVTDKPYGAGWYGIRLHGLPASPPDVAAAPAPEPVEAVLMTLDDDVSTRTSLYLNGEKLDASADRVTPYLSKFPVTILPTDRLVLTASDTKGGAVAYALVSKDGKLLAYSRAAVYVSGEPAAHETSLVDVLAEWERAAIVERKDIAPLYAAGVPPTRPADWAGIWLPSAQTGRCSVLVWPTPRAAKRLVTDH